MLSLSVAFFLIDFYYFPFTTSKRPCKNSRIVTDFHWSFVFSVFSSTIPCMSELCFCDRYWSCTSTEKACYIWCVSYDIPWFVCDDHFYEDISRKDIFLFLLNHHLFESDDIMERDKTVEDVFSRLNISRLCMREVRTLSSVPEITRITYHSGFGAKSFDISLNGRDKIIFSRFCHGSYFELFSIGCCDLHWFVLWLESQRDQLFEVRVSCCVFQTCYCWREPW